MRYIFIILSFLINSCFIIGQQIILDDAFDDWNTVSNKFMDAAGDVPANFIDFTDVAISNDDRFLFLYFKLNKEINIQENNEITIYIDIDNNENTGKKTNGIGADIVYNLGKRQGFLYSGNNTFLVYHNNIGLVTSPTVTGYRFEMAISRNFIYNNESIQMRNQIRIALADEINRGDKAPDRNGGYAYIMDDNIRFVSNVGLAKSDPNVVRMMSYNVLKDRLFNNSVRQNYDRIFKAVNPDILGFCEIYDNSSAQVAGLIESFLPSTGNQKWYHASGDPDIRLVSRYPILSTRSIDGNMAFLIDLGKEKLVAIVAHLPCCNNEVSRQAEVDNIMAFIRGIKFGISAFQVPPNSPIVIMGDMNFVGLSQQLNTFITGNIINNSKYGPSFKPDWDNTDLEDLRPMTSGLPMSFTWNSESGSYSAGRLDYMIYSGSVIQPVNSFVLWTPEMSTSDLNAFGLQRSDIIRASDHAPVIGDFKMERVSATDEDLPTSPLVFKQKDGHWYLNAQDSGQLILSDISGRVIVNYRIDNVGDQIIDLPPLSGLFILSFQTSMGIISTKIYR